jgi:hypothetical protein
VERWEEQSGYSPSTIAAEIAGLVAAADLARANGDAASAAVWLGVADDMQRSVKGWTVTTNGPLSAIRTSSGCPRTGDPNERDHVRASATAGRRSTSGGHRRRLPRAGAPRLLPASRSRRRPIPADRGRHDQVDDTERPGWHRYNGDGYGDRGSDGRPWAPCGRAPATCGRCCRPSEPSRRLASGDAATAASLLNGMRKFASGVGLIPEQDWELADLPIAVRHDPTVASIGFANGKAAGSASPLTWSAAAFVRLAADLVAGRNVVLPAVTHARYVAQRRRQPTLTVTQPADHSLGQRLAGHGQRHDSPGNTVYVAPTTLTRTRRRRWSRLRRHPTARSASTFR